MQKYTSILFFLVSFSITFFTLTLSSHAQTSQETTSRDPEQRYISDELFTFMRSGPSADFRLIGSISAGSKITLLEVNRDAGYAKITDDRGRTGWVQSKFVSRKPSIRESLVIMQQKIDDKQSELDELNEQLELSFEKLENVERQKTLLNREVTQHLEQISALNESIESREKANNMQWFTHGAILGVVSLIIGYLMGIFARKQNNSNRLM